MIVCYIIDLSISKYNDDDYIIFGKIQDDKFNHYLEISYTENKKCSKPLYFRWKDIPFVIYALYRQSQKYFQNCL